MSKEAILAAFGGQKELPRGRMAEIAQELGITRQAVREIAQAAGVRVKSREARCPKCKKETQKPGVCDACRKPVGPIEVACNVCGRMFARRRSWVERSKGQHYCSRECWAMRKKAKSEER